MSEKASPQKLYPDISNLFSTESDQGFVHEIYPNLSHPVTWKTLVINTGASHGTLQDIKLPEYSGGYTFSLGGARRSLFWRVSHVTLELVEESTDVDIQHGHLRLQFPDSPILEGISVHETPSSLVLLLATVSTVHRLRLPATAQHVRGGLSLLHQLTAQQLRQPDAMHALHAHGNAPLPHTAASCLLPSGEAVFFLAGPAGGGQLVRYLASGPGPLAAAHELQTGSVVGRLLGGLFADPAQQRAESAALLPGAEPALAAVCRDARLRLWSVSRRAPLAEIDLLALAPERRRPAAGARRHRLRTLTTAAGGEELLAAHLCLETQQVFVLLRAALVRGAWQTEHLATVCAPDHDLIDFALTEEALWSLWSTAEADTQVRYYPYPVSGGGEAGWRQVALEPSPPPVHLTPAVHLSQTYLKHIFHPGRFQPSTIQRAVSIYSRTECAAEAQGLREAVVATVEAEIQQAAAADDFQLPDDKFTELALAAWDGFYSACLQYHQVGTKPLGLVCDSGSGQACLVRQAFVSYLRPAGLLERLWLGEDAEPQDLPEDEADEVMCDVARLVQCCRLLERHVGAELAAAVRQDLTHLVSPDVVALSAVGALEADPGAELAELRDELALRLAAVGSLTAALARLGALLQVSGEELPAAAGCGGQFSSRLGCGLLAAGVEQSLRARYSLASHLLLLQTLLLSMQELSADEQSAVRAKFIPETVIQVQAYFGLLWLVETPAEPVSADRQEAAQRQLAALAVDDVAAPSGDAAPSERLTLLQLFVAGPGGAAARGHVADGDGEGAAWGRLYPALAAALLRLVWPVSRQSALPELLLAASQHAALREYVRLHQTWCDWNSASRRILLGLALLSLGQPDKAFDVFVASADAVGKEEPLLTRLLRLDPAPDEPHARVLVRYYLRVIQLFELQHLGDWVLELAAAGVHVAEDGDPNVPTLWSIAFKYHLRLGHVHEAYEAMTSNPDASRRRDCLRQLVVTLHERRDLATLVSLPYVDLLADVVAILEDRARASDPLTSRFYDVLFAFHVHRANYRRAGRVMYECGRRLAGEPGGLKRQAHSYLACVNTLQLVSAEYAWIVRPELEEAGAGPARVAVLTLEEIRKEADLVSARLRLQEWEETREAGGGGGGAAGASPQELLARLVAARLYTDAVQVARAHRLSVEPVVRELAAALAAGAADGAAWLWLGDCRLPAGAAAGSAAEQTAALLREVLAAAPAGDTRLLRAAAERLLQLGRPLPGWLQAEYERRGAAELGRLLLRAGQLEQAARLLLRLLEALLGSGTENFGLDSALHANAPPVWLPYTLLDQVLAELGDRKGEPVYRQLERALTERLETYQETLGRVSRDMAALD